MNFKDAERFEASVRLLHEVCRISHPAHDYNSSGSLFATDRLRRALQMNDNSAIYDWLMMVFSYQGVADKAVETIINRDGNADWKSVERSIARKPRCAKLHGFWAFDGCGYSKNKGSCNCPSEIRGCPLPRLPLRNGALNQLAYSLFLFIRDVADGDFIGWLDSRVEACSGGPYAEIETAIISPLRAVHGISDKVISMAISDLLMASPDRSHWRRLGAEFVVVDRLVHNFMHRSGILRRHACEHLYGPGCYGNDGCASLLLSLSRGIDMRRYSASFPQPFPRFVQTAIWRYCAASGENVCNGNQIDDDRRCRNEVCKMQSLCTRVALRPAAKGH